MHLSPHSLSAKLRVLQTYVHRLVTGALAASLSGASPMLLHKRLQGRNPALPRALLFPLVLLLLRLLFKLIKK